MSDYYVRAKVGPYSWEVTSGDLASELVAPVQHLDNWAIGWDMPDGTTGELYPGQLPPLGATLFVRTLDTANLDQLAEGQDMAVEAWTADPTVDVDALKFASFYGRLSDVDAVPYVNPDDDTTWMVYTLVGTDYTVDLAQIPIPACTWVAEGTYQRFTAPLIPDGVPRLASYFPADAPLDTDTVVGFYGSNPGLRARTITGGDLLTEVLFHLEAVVTDDMLDAGAGLYNAPARPMLVPVCSWADGLTGFELQYWAAEMTGDADYLPGVPELVPDGAGGLQLVIDWDTTALDPDAGGWGPAAAISGGSIVRTSAGWKLATGRLTAVQETLPEGQAFVDTAKTSMEYDSGELPRQLLSRETIVQNSLSALEHARFYVQAAGQVPENWAIAGFTYRVPQDQLGVMAFIPDHAGGAVLPNVKAVWPSMQPAVVYGIEDGKSPTGKAYVTGRLTAVTLTITQGRVELTARLRRGYAPPNPLNSVSGITMAQLNAAFPDVTDQPRHTANKVANPGFEADLSTWNTPGANCTLVRTLAQHMHGVAACQVTITGVGGGVAYFTQPIANAIPVVPGRTYTVSMYWKPAAVRLAGAYVQFYTAADAFISQPVVADAAPAAGVWTRCFGSVVAPAGAAKMLLAPVVVVNAGDTGMVHYLDSIQVEDTTELLPYEAPEYPTRYLDPELSWDDFNLVRSV